MRYYIKYVSREGEQVIAAVLAYPGERAGMTEVSREKYEVACAELGLSVESVLPRGRLPEPQQVIMSEEDIRALVDAEIEKATEKITEQATAAAASEWEKELRDLGISVTPDANAKYDGTKRYIPGDTMVFDGKTYENLKACKDQTPETHPELWKLVENEEVILVWLDCDTNHPFKENEKVSHIGYIWRCKKDHKKGNVRVPLDGSDWWEIVLEIKAVRG